jgi:hypothetical protein
MAIITGIKFRTPGKVYYFAPGELQPKYNDHVIVETARGLEYGRVVLPVRDVPEEELKQPLKEVIRIATKEDARQPQKGQTHHLDKTPKCGKEFCQHPTFWFSDDGHNAPFSSSRDAGGTAFVRHQIKPQNNSCKISSAPGV